MGRSSWLKTLPMAWPLASVVTRNGFAKSGKARIGSDMMASLSKMKACSASSFHAKVLDFLRVEVMGEAMCA